MRQATRSDQQLDYVTINELYARLHAEGSCLSKHFLRSLVDSGVIPHLPAGNRKLIRYSVACDTIRHLEKHGGTA